jgi:hypothetical protein
MKLKLTLLGLDFILTLYLNVNYNVVLYTCMCISRSPDYAINFKIKLNGRLEKNTDFGNFSFGGISVIDYIVELQSNAPYFFPRLFLYI